MKLVEMVLMTLAGVWQGIRQDLNPLELVLLASLAWAWKRGWRPGAWVAYRPAWVDHVVRYPAAAAIALAWGTVGLRLALLPLLPAPVPLVTDEFSHLLLADTLLHGRLANPTHPFWRHFESLHILQRPHYVSNYFPGHAAMLAAGRLLLQSEWAAILAGCALFLMVLYWALRAWMPARWALFGVALAGLRFGIASYWVNAFHAGFLPAIGGALLLGAYPRLKRAPSWTHGLLLAAGFAVLMATRPFEGLFFSLPLAGMLLWELRRSFGGLLKVAVPSVALVGITAAALMTYFTSVTGSPFVTAYQISQKTYGWPMALAWTPPPKVQEPHIEFTQYYEYELLEHEKVSGPLNFVEYLTFRIQEYWRFFIGPLLSIPLLLLPRVWRRRRMLLAPLIGALFAVLLEGASSPHYISPATVAIVAVLVECIRHMQASRLGQWRIRIAPALLAGMALMLTVRIALGALGLPYTQKLNYQSWCCKVEGNQNKVRIAAELERIPGQHLVLVDAKTDPNNLFQWVYNSADIDNQKIVWARSLGGDANRALEAYFLGRQVWRVNPNVEPAALTPLAPSPIARQK